MSPLINRVIDEIQRNPNARQIVAAPKLYAQLRRECLEVCGAIYPMPPGSEALGFQLWGLPVHQHHFTGYCRNCGAAAEPVRCSFCLSPSDFVEVK